MNNYKMKVKYLGADGKPCTSEIYDIHNMSIPTPSQLRPNTLDVKLITAFLVYADSTKKKLTYVPMEKCEVSSIENWFDAGTL